MSFTIAGIPAKRIAAQTVLSAVAGLTCSKCYRNLKAHPGTGVKIVKYSIAGGISGGLVALGAGILYGRGVTILILSHTMSGSLMTAVYCNLRSVITNEEFKLVGGEKPIGGVLVSSVSGGLTGIIGGILSQARPTNLVGICSAGLVMGFFGHLLYKKACIIRLEFLLRQNYPELIMQHREADEYMHEQQISNPYYDGPIKGNPPWMDYVASFWGDFGKRKFGEDA